ncbi:MAG: sugar ABC transporter permease [Nocardiopsaceae bacterium]|nr:sugar ABC transporter permease [Nocardiopsaceae bacterium]
MSALATPATPPAPPHRRSSGIRRGEGLAGWLFTLPVIILLGIFLLVPVLMALWVSFSDWNGNGSPLSSSVKFIGLQNYADLTTGGGLAERNFGLSLRNNLWYVVLVVPLQTIIALLLAVLVSRRLLTGRGFFRTAYYFPSVTSAVAITVLWMFLFAGSGAVNEALAWLGVNGPDWFNEPTGLWAVVAGWFGMTQPPDWMNQGGFLSVTPWEWLQGPSVAMFAYILMAVFTTSGTFMLIFMAAIQNIDPALGEAGMIDGANGWQRFWRITLPQLRPALFTVLTLGLIGCWQVFDQIYAGTQGDPAKTTLTPAYLSYQASLGNQQWGDGAAIAFILFVIIVAFTLFQRWVLRDRPVSKRRIRAYQPKAAKKGDAS